VAETPADPCRLGQEGLPFRIQAAEGQSEPVGRRERPAKEAKPRVLRPAVLLLRVAPATRRDDVLPTVLTTTRPRDDVIEVLGRRAAVLAGPRVPGENGAPGEWGLGPVRDPDEVPEPEYRWSFDLVPLGTEDHAIGDDDLRLLLQDEHHRPPGGHDCQRLVGRVEYERSSHSGPAASIASGLRNPAQVLESAKSQGCNPAEGGGWIVSEGSGRLN